MQSVMLLFFTRPGTLDTKTLKVDGKASIWSGYTIDLKSSAGCIAREWGWGRSQACVWLRTRLEFDFTICAPRAQEPSTSLRNPQVAAEATPTGAVLAMPAS